MSCPRCGSWEVRRDRSLAGRMVCGRCSLPLGPGARQASSGLRRLNPLGSGGRGHRRNWLMPVALLLILSALLAWLSEQPQPRQIPFGQEQDRLR
ncbi:transcriptional regulator [Synechococcus sp. Cruz-9H2]|uniref:transcriptional regulator n=1 Tax=unclassified Synechococcus TaxID=2626047 RepID=UPI0020CC20B1|nr:MULTISPECIES: transcriptional regulator [unclassified Synechococcus]MCP9819208.1 transcriptional regulator [Synechococcus sp. Cruz-9H2]MCP9843712.1 transcriptional regulator [Synechococcus sp. Edmonson 11F2]MCP9855569.1 transcriptional regulator [Synechococcus sp. Cruz-9C9]MCP9863007.1 transcriptional regulator [Synechococcus sp. Cruz-7E5]MCP9870118.1 transcriptional regulator [Synechococcus sp. Cruz-7B9]